jgi:2-oxoglutarate dehydrogenase E2 component (dihydrolipoamide succinyltransferase)
MAVQVQMPHLGESVDEGVITKWLIAEGDFIEEYEPLLEVNTDKVDTEIPSPASGVLLKILVSEGTTVQAGSVLAWIGEEHESPLDGEPESQISSTSTNTTTTPTTTHNVETSTRMETPAPGRDQELGFISPIVARIASEHGIDLYQIIGTGKGGRITKRDVLAFLEADNKQVLDVYIASTPEPTPLRQNEVLPLSPVRRAIAEHMVLSKRTSPHVTTVMEVDLSRVVAHREANKAAYAKDGANLTFTVYFIASTVAALKTYPLVNSSWSDDGIILHKEINIGMATSLGEEGLIVPVIKNADELSMLGLARSINDLSNRARAKQLQPDEVKGGTFTITNHGTSGSLFATPIINQPQCAILGVGAIQKRAIVIEDAIAIRPMVYISLTFDHRILDGAIGDYFLGKVVESLLSW